MREKVKNGIVVILIFIWMLSGSLIDSNDGGLFFAINMLSICALFFIAYLDGYVY